MQMAVVLGGREQVIHLPDGSRLKDLLEALEKKYGKQFAEILYGAGNKEKHPEVQLLLNGRNIFFLDGFDTRLNDGDELFFLTPVGGG